MASVVLILVIASAFGAFVTSKMMYSTGVAELNLERSALAITGKMIRGIEEQGNMYGLRLARSYELPSVTPAGSAIYFTGTDLNIRKFYLNGNSVSYESPTQSPGTQTIYTAPTGTSIILRFWNPPGYIDNETVGIYVGLIQNIGTRTVSGSVSTYVNIKNIPK